MKPLDNETKSDFSFQNDVANKPGFYIGYEHDTATVDGPKGPYILTYASTQLRIAEHLCLDEPVSVICPR